MDHSVPFTKTVWCAKGRRLKLKANICESNSCLSESQPKRGLLLESLRLPLFLKESSQ